MIAIDGVAAYVENTTVTACFALYDSTERRANKHALLALIVIGSFADDVLNVTILRIKSGKHHRFNSIDVVAAYVKNSTTAA